MIRKPLLPAGLRPPHIPAALWMAAAVVLAAATPGGGLQPEPEADRAVADTVAGSDTTRAGLSGAELDAMTARVAAQLRCPVCRSQSVLESSAQLARSMLAVIRERLAAGHTPEEIEAYFVARYGEQILLKPRPRGINIVVYVLPALLLVAGLLLLRERLARWRRRATAAVTAGEEPQVAPPPAGKDGVATGRDGVAAGGEGRVPGGRDDPAAAALSEEDERWLEQAIRSS